MNRLPCGWTIPLGQGKSPDGRLMVGRSSTLLMVKFQKLRLPQRANFVSNSVKSLMLVGKWGTLVASVSLVVFGNALLVLNPDKTVTSQLAESQLAESQLAECLYVGVRNRVRARDRG